MADKIDVKKMLDVSSVVINALQNEADKSTNKVTSTDVNKIAPPVAQKVENAVKEQVQPVIDHLTNQEPWYQSRVTWGAIFAGAAGIAGLLGYSFSVEDQQYWIDTTLQGVQLVTAVVSLVGGAIAWYGRWKAKKPIGQ